MDAITPVGPAGSKGEAHARAAARIGHAAAPSRHPTISTTTRLPRILPPLRMSRCAVRALPRSNAGAFSRAGV
jgi:hypothetical protein